MAHSFVNLSIHRWYSYRRGFKV